MSSPISNNPSTQLNFQGFAGFAELFKDVDVAEKVADAKTDLVKQVTQAETDAIANAPPLAVKTLTQVAETGTTANGVASSGGVEGRRPKAFSQTNPDSTVDRGYTTESGASSSSDTDEKLGTPLQAGLEEEGGADAATSAAPVPAAAPAAIVPGAPAGSYMPSDWLDRTTEAWAVQQTGQGKVITPKMAANYRAELAKKTDVHEINPPAIAREYAAAAAAKGEPISEEAEAEIAAEIHNEMMDNGKGSPYRQGGQFAAFLDAIHRPGGEKFMAGSPLEETGANASSFFGGGSGSSWLGKAAKVALGVGATALVVTNPILSLIPGANVAMLGMGGLLATVGGMGNSRSRMGGGEDAAGMEGMFSGAAGMESEMRRLMGQVALGTSGGRALTGSSGGVLSSIGNSVGGGGFLGGLTGAAMSVTSTLGGLNGVQGLSTTGMAADAALYGDSSNRIKAAQTANARTAGFLSQLQNKSIDIDELMMMFAAFITADGDDEQRENMRKLANQKQVENNQKLLEEQWNRTKGKAQASAQMAGGIASAAAGIFLGPAGGMAGGAISSAFTSAANKPFEIAEQSGAKAATTNALSGQGVAAGQSESSELMLMKVQAGMDKYKRTIELISNLIKMTGQTKNSIVNNIRS